MRNDGVPGMKLCLSNKEIDFLNTENYSILLFISVSINFVRLNFTIIFLKKIKLNLKKAIDRWESIETWKSAEEGDVVAPGDEGLAEGREGDRVALGAAHRHHQHGPRTRLVPHSRQHLPKQPKNTCQTHRYFKIIKCWQKASDFNLFQL